MGLLSNLMSKIFSHGGVQLRVEQWQDNQWVRPRSGGRGRNRLATELHYTGDPNDSASMNIWLHKQVLQKISENGGKVPAELLR
jgi:hypothetical protein